jgi:hypothetical protein
MGALETAQKQQKQKQQQQHTIVRKVLRTRERGRNSGKIATDFFGT